MGVSKKYYWLKLKENFFKQREIKKLRRIAGGDTYTVIYLKMQLLAMKTGGWLYFEGTEKNMIHQLELELDEDYDNIEILVNFLVNNNLLEFNQDLDFFLPEVIESTGKETDSARRVRKHRQSKALQSNADLLQSNTKTLQRNIPVTKCNTEIEIEIETEIEKDNVDSDEIDDYTKFFESIWNLYPKKQGKSKILKSKSKLQELFKIGFDEMQRAILRYTKTTIGIDSKFVKHGSTFFTNDYKDFLDKNYSEENYKQEKVKKGSNLPANMDNFDQREYTEKDFEEFYYNPTKE